MVDYGLENSYVDHLMGLSSKSPTGRILWRSLARHQRILKFQLQHTARALDIKYVVARSYTQQLSFDPHMGLS
jgi:hypothetical protein